MTQLMIALTNVSFMIQRNTQKHKLLQYQVHTVKGQEKRYIEFKNLRLNDIRPFQNKITEGEKLQFFLSPSKKTPSNSGKQSEWLSTPHWEISYRCSARNMPGMTWRNYHDTDGINSKVTPQNESFSDFLKHLKKTTKQASDLKTNGYVNAFLFGKLPVPIQNAFIQRRKQTRCHGRCN